MYEQEIDWHDNDKYESMSDLLVLNMPEGNVIAETTDIIKIASAPKNSKKFEKYILSLFMGHLQIEPPSRNIYSFSQHTLFLRVMTSDFSEEQVRTKSATLQI